MFSRSKSASSATIGSFYDIVEKTSDGNDFSFENFRGKVVYGVNVASKCGKTKSGYELIQKIVKLKDQGVEVALFPCNQFLWQEPGTNADIAEFCYLNGGQNALVFEKGDVNGGSVRPTYKYLKDKGVLGIVKWNFDGKFIIDRQGNAHPVADDSVVERDVLEYLNQPAET